MAQFLRVLSLFVIISFMPLATRAATAPDLSLPADATGILAHIYSGDWETAITEARQMQERAPEHPLGYLLEGEARWWTIWCSAAEFKYGMTMPRHRDRLAADQPYMEAAAKAYKLAEVALKHHETAEMRLYAGMADALAARLYGLRQENRATARAGVRARENFQRALALDPSLADAYTGLGLYNYYVDTLSSFARLLRFFMGIPGGSKEDGIRQLQRAAREGRLTPPLARFYLAMDLHNYDQKYEEALRAISPLVEQYPENPFFQLARGDLYAKLGRKQQALASYRAAGAAKLHDEECYRKIQLLVRQSVGALGLKESTTKP
ncbi:MAG TPA: tetratricopeptide repeat protein [Candidatus Acidoferrum sp.]